MDTVWSIENNTVNLKSILHGHCLEYSKQHSELKIDIAWTLFGVLKTTLYLINGIT